VITLVDSGAGNLRSVEKAFASLGAEVRVTFSPSEVEAAGKLVLPGVGAFGECMRSLRERGLVEPLRRAVARGTPLLGICVGMQVLFESGTEEGEHEGLGLLPGRVVRLRTRKLRIPHTGWNQLWPERDAPLLHGVAAGEYVHFNHSYSCEAPREVTLAWTRYPRPYPSIVGRGTLCGIQFHPEKSQRVGLRLLRNFLERV
jgi:glutamine amidotransferase